MMMLPTAALVESDVLAVTLWAEGRGEPVEGRIAIACVIRNRMDRRHKTAREICLAPFQFSCWNEGNDANHQALTAMVDALNRGEDIADPVFRECQWIAKGVLSGAVRDNVKRADHYLTTSLLMSGNKPGWAATMTWCATIGAHTFYRS
jgi:N-acetylmuramoyl-L-alanine amidase